MSNFENLKKKFDRFFESFSGDEIKIFGSGSFLDEKQILKEGRKYFIRRCKEAGVKKLTIESRPEFITKEKLDEFGFLELAVAIGLEIANDKILDKLKKGFHLRDFEKAVKIIRGCEAKVRTYLLVNPPFVENIKKSLDSSVKYALKFSDSIVLINLLPHQDSELFNLWLRGEWNFLSKKEFFRLTQKFKANPKIELDVETFKFVPRFPKELRKPLVGVGEEFLTHPYYEIWQDYLWRWYEPPESKNILLFLPCSYRKPYSESETHRKILEQLRKLKNYEKIHQVMISSPGIIPREFENYYPFNAYDWGEKLETKEIKERYVDVVSGRIERYLGVHRNSYKKIFCYLKYESESFQALEIASENLKLELKNLLDKKRKGERVLRQEESLKDLYRGLKDL